MHERSIRHDEAVAFLLASHSTIRVGTPRETRHLAGYVANVKVNFIQGSIIDIDNGASISITGRFKRCNTNASNI
jgi:hypothetical protein